MHVITRVRFDLPVGFDARILIALCCDDIVWEDHRVLSASILGQRGTARLGGVLGDPCFYGSFYQNDGESSQRMIEAVQRRLDWLCRSRICQREDEREQVQYRAAA